MKPLRLTMSAFGPYAGEQILDFNDLAGRSFFLIHGPTGSGKTTILDAICFGLYGDTSGALRDGKSMRSDHAGDDTATEVTFDFAIGLDCYRVTRRPEQERASKRGGGTVTDTAKATLWNLSEDGKEQVLASGADKVTRKVETLLGFKSSQFRQVVLLPQGDFRKLLTADSQQRQQIMQTLFKTEFYRQIEELLKQKSQEMEKAQQTLANEDAWVLREAAVNSAPELSERLNNNTAEQKKLAQELTVLAGQVQAAERALAEARMVEAKLQEQSAAMHASAELEGKIAVVDEKRLELAAAIGAASFADAEQQLRRLAKDAEQLRVRISSQELQLTTACRDEEQARALLLVEQGKEPEREQALFAHQQLLEMQDKVTLLQAAIAHAKECHHTAESVNSCKKAVVAETTLIGEKLSQATVDYEANREVALQADNRKAAWETAEKQVEKRHKLISCQQQVEQKGEVLVTLRAKLNRMATDYSTAKTKLADEQAKWAGAQAAIMAAQLTPGIACPVCGSEHHPRKATGAGNIPSEQELKAAQVRLDKLDQDRGLCQQQLASQEAEYLTWKNRLSDLAAELGEVGATTAIKDLQAASLQAKASYYAAGDAAKRAQSLASEIEQLTERQKSLAEGLEKLEGDVRNADSACRAADAVVAERRQGIPAELDSDKALKMAQLTALQRLQSLKTALDNAQATFDAASRRVTALRTGLAGLIEQLTALTTRIENEGEAFIARLKEAGFANMADYHAAKKATDYIKLLEERIIKFDQDLAAAKLRKERAVQAAAGLIAPDMAALEAALVSVKAQQTEVFTRHTTLNGQLSRERQWLARLAEVAAATAKIAGRYSILGKLAQVANGKNQYGVTLQRFVLGHLLDDVAIAANERLKMMSRGRYFLQRTNDRARSNSAGGLQLEVFDNHTGVARPVNTLSGGESFLASLSLALGMADVVQAYSGGIHLDTIFVDEGFGTLDPETLEYALQALIELQQGGRLVGIISHVPELKERIDTRLEVTATDNGSVAAFKVS